MGHIWRENTLLLESLKAGRLAAKYPVWDVIYLTKGVDKITRTHGQNKACNKNYYYIMSVYAF